MITRRLRSVGLTLYFPAFSALSAITRRLRSVGLGTSPQRVSLFHFLYPLYLPPPFKGGWEGLHFLVFRQYTLEFLCREAQAELTVHCHSDSSCLLAHHYCYCIAFLRNAHGGSMAQTKFLWNLQVVRHRQDTARTLDSFVRYDHCSVVEW